MTRGNMLGFALCGNLGKQRGRGGAQVRAHFLRGVRARQASARAIPTGSARKGSPDAQTRRVPARRTARAPAAPSNGPPRTPHGRPAHCRRGTARAPQPRWHGARRRRPGQHRTARRRDKTVHRGNPPRAAGMIRPASGPIMTAAPGNEKALGRHIGIEIGERPAHALVLGHHRLGGVPADRRRFRRSRAFWVKARAAVVSATVPARPRRRRCPARCGWPRPSFRCRWRLVEPRAQVLGGLDVGLQDLDQGVEAQRFLERGEGGRVDGGGMVAFGVPLGRIGDSGPTDRAWAA